MSDQLAGRRWLTEVLEPRMRSVSRPGPRPGDAPALEALARRSAPAESAATLVLADTQTEALPVLNPQPMEALDQTFGGGSAAAGT